MKSTTNGNGNSSLREANNNRLPKQGVFNRVLTFTLQVCFVFYNYGIFFYAIYALNTTSGLPDYSNDENYLSQEEIGTYIQYSNYVIYGLLGFVSLTILITLFTPKKLGNWWQLACLIERLYTLAFLRYSIFTIGVAILAFQTWIWVRCRTDPLTCGEAPLTPDYTYLPADDYNALYDTMLQMRCNWDKFGDSASLNKHSESRVLGRDMSTLFLVCRRIAGACQDYCQKSNSIYNYIFTGVLALTSLISIVTYSSTVCPEFPIENQVFGKIRGPYLLLFQKLKIPYFTFSSASFVDSIPTMAAYARNIPESQDKEDKESILGLRKLYSNLFWKAAEDLTLQDHKTLYQTFVDAVPKLSNKSNHKEEEEEELVSAEEVDEEDVDYRYWEFLVKRDEVGPVLEKLSAIKSIPVPIANYEFNIIPKILVRPSNNNETSIFVYFLRDYENTHMVMREIFPFKKYKNKFVRALIVIFFPIYCLRSLALLYGRLFYRSLLNEPIQIPQVAWETPDWNFKDLTKPIKRERTWFVGWPFYKTVTPFKK